MSVTTINLTPALYEYLLKVSLREPEVLKKLRDQTRKMSTAGMQISPEQGQFMQLLIQLIGAKKTLDVGVFTGYSALSVALALPADGKVTACDVNVEWTKIARRFWEEAGVTDKIDLRLAPALETLQRLIDDGQGGTYDFAFIDADKANYPAYYEKCLALLRQGGLIMVDNVLWGGDVADPAVNDANTRVIREVNEMIHQDERVTMSLLPLGDGVTLAVKK